MEYFVTVKNDVYRAFNDMRKCLWCTVACRRQDVKSHPQCDPSHVKQLEKNLRMEKHTHKPLTVVVPA